MDKFEASFANFHEKAHFVKAATSAPFVAERYQWSMNRSRTAPY
jgi:hypothetical protein